MDDSELVPHGAADLRPCGDQRGVIAGADVEANRIRVDEGIEIAAIGDIDRKLA